MTNRKNETYKNKGKRKIEIIKLNDVELDMHKQRFLGKPGSKKYIEFVKSLKDAKKRILGVQSKNSQGSRRRMRGGLSNGRIRLFTKGDEFKMRKLLDFANLSKWLTGEEEFEDKLNTLFTSGLDFDICMISYIVQKSEDVNEFPFVKRVLNGQTTSGYIIREQFYDKLIGLYEWANPLLANTKQHWNYACDTVWKRLQPTSKWYCMTDRFGIQRPSYSDCSNSFGNYES
jgi:hypothetical protein